MKPYFTDIAESISFYVQYWSQRIDFVWPIVVKQSYSGVVHSARFTFKNTVNFRFEQGFGIYFLPPKYIKPLDRTNFVQFIDLL